MYDILVNAENRKCQVDRVAAKNLREENGLPPQEYFFYPTKSCIAYWIEKCLFYPCPFIEAHSQRICCIGSMPLGLSREEHFCREIGISTIISLAPSVVLALQCSLR